MGIEIIGKLTQKNNGDFKLVDLADVDYDGTGKSAKQELENKIEEAKNSSTPYDDSAIKADINNIKTDLGTEELTTTSKKIKGAINVLNSQIKDIATNINNKADKNEVFKKSVGININDFDESTRKTFLELQGVDVNYILGDENVKPSNTTFFRKKLNYFNKSSILSLKQFSETGQITEGDRAISDKIKVSVGKKYYILSTSPNWLDKLFIYDINKNTIYI